jgi:hypothetical protein
LGPSLRKRIQNYEYKTRHESEYLWRMRKEITENYKSKKIDTTTVTKSREII